MSRAVLVTLLSLLVGSGLAHAKATPRSQPAPAPAAPPATLLTPAPSPAAPVEGVLISEHVPPGPAWLAEKYDSFCGSGAGRERQGEFTANAEYVLWYPADKRDPRALASTDVLSQSTARVLSTLGDERLERHLTSGGRLTLGYWLTEENPWVGGGEIRSLGVEARFFFVGQRSAESGDASSPTIVRPFFDVNNRRESDVIVAAPGLATGGIVSHAAMEIWGGEANVWKNAYYNDPGTTFSVDVLAGFRYLDVDQDINISRQSTFNTNLTAFPAFAPLAGNRIQEGESFTVRNHFYGGQVGVSLKGHLDLFTVEGLFKVAVGTTREEMQIAGSQVRTMPNGTATIFPGALLALPSNSGRFERSKFAQVPELGGNLLFPLLPHVTFSTGFTALFLSRLMRAADQIDRGVDVTAIPNFVGAAGAPPATMPRPAMTFEQSSLWLLGITFGVEVKW